MIIIPEAETVVILTPRAGSTALKQMLMHNRMYPQAFMPYRHMEADGVPAGYEHYTRVGLVRKPLDRLWSLYCFLQRAVDNPKPKWYKFNMDVHRRDIENGFIWWAHYGAQAFATSIGAGGAIDPRYHTLHPKPEHQKSQYAYLRPDLGTIVYKFTDMHKLVRMIASKSGNNPDECLLLTEKINHASTIKPQGVLDLFADVERAAAGASMDSVSPLAEKLFRTFSWDAGIAGGWR